ncbi:TonB-dependent receptor [Novosphingobium sp. PC22D]|uniref:TonB-dependent receptor n=1 Tax=Novosphingobium sp. PC22D TaxID=1962403 RepID=UPI00143BE597|nr:TonB-dependent receptor [Novosphingobium sp. PC22D]
MKRKIVALLCGTACVFASSQALAQAADDSDEEAAASSGFGDIIVTARKRDETLQNVPVAVTAIGGTEIADTLASDLTKVAELAPQVSIGEGGSGTGAVIAIRGISSSSSDAGFDQSVLVELDGVPFSRGTIIGARLFDTQNVQVLSGPQALYFGKNSPAGVISINSADPTFSLEGYLTGGYEFTADQAYSEGAVSGPLSSTLAARFAFRASTMKGWTRNVAPVVPGLLDPSVPTAGANYGKRMPNSDELAGRVSLLWEPEPTFSAKLKFTVNSVEANTGNGNSEPYCIGDTTEPITLGQFPLPGADCEANRVTSHGGVPEVYARNARFANGGVPYLDKIFYFGVLELNKSFDNFDIALTSGYYDEDIKLMNTTDWSPYANIWAAARYQYTLLSQEIRVSTSFDGPLNFMVGGYWEYSKRPFDNVPEILHVYNPVADNYVSADMHSDTKGEYLSAFAEVSWKILETLELSGGARWSRDTKKLDQVNLSLGPNFQYLYPVGEHFLADYSDKHVSPEVTLTWRPNTDHTAYVAYKTGYKSGGISNPFLLPATATPESVLFRPEIAEGFEAGYKASLMGGTLRFDFNVYTYKYDDLQVVSADNSGVIQAFNLTNAAASRVKGVQASLNWQATDTLRFNGNLGLNSAKYTKFNTAQCYNGQTAAEGCLPADPNNPNSIKVQDLSGTRLVRAPKLTFSFGGDYSPELVSGLKTTISASGSYSGDYQASTDNAPGGRQKAYWIVNAALKVGSEDGAYELALLGRNLTNSYYKLQAYAWTAAGNPDQYVGFWNRPREVALQGTVRF